MRIISLVPSLTELLFDLGLEASIVGRTKFCIHPKDKVRHVAKIGGTKNVNIPTVQSLRPDLIIANKEENTKSDVEALKKICPVHITDISDYHTAINAINEIGELTNTIKRAKTIIDSIESEFEKISQLKIERKSVCYLIWNDPMMTVGNDTFIHDMLERCGLLNVFENETRYPIIDEKILLEKNPDYIFLSSEPFPFKQTHISRYKELCPNSKVILVDEEYYSWYGSRMISATAYFNKLVQELST